MKIIDSVRRSGRNLKAAKLRTFLTATAISVGGFTLTLTLAAANGAHSYTEKLIQSNFDPHSVFVAKDKDFFSNGASDKPQEYNDDLGLNQGRLLQQLNQKDLDKLKQLPHVKQVTANYDLTSQFITRDGAKRYTGALIVYKSNEKPTTKAGNAPETLPSGSVLMSDSYLDLLNFKSAQDAIGKTITVQVRQPAGATQSKQYTIVAVTTKSSLSINFDGTGLYISEADARDINSFVKGGTLQAQQFPTANVQGDGVDANILKQEVIDAGFQAKTSQDLQQLIGQIINILQVIIIVFGIITLVASFFGVVNTQYISVLERTREIGLMKALGMSRNTVSRLFIIEATWIGFLGAAMGSAGAIILGTLVNPGISKKLNFGSEHLLIFRPNQVIALIIFLMFITTLAGFLPSRKAAKLDPIEALRTE